MVVVPSFTQRQQRHPPIVGGEIPGGKAARTPNMRGGVDQPRGVQSQHGAEENAPQQERPSADREECGSQNHRWRKMVFCDPYVKLVRGQVWHIAVYRVSVLPQRVANQNPARMRPPLAISRRV